MIVGESLTLQLRKDLFLKILKMPIKWFDQPEHNPGNLTDVLASKAQQVNGLASSVIGFNVQNMFTMVSGIIISFIASWRVALINLSFFPVMIVAQYFQMKWMEGYSNYSSQALSDANQIVSESVTNIRTVISFSQKSVIMNAYKQKHKKVESIIRPRAHKAGLALGFSQIVQFVMFAVTFYTGALFYRDHGLSINRIFISILALFYAAMGAGNNAQFMPDMGAVKSAASKIFSILDAADETSTQIDQSQIKIKPMIKGKI